MPGSSNDLSASTQARERIAEDVIGATTRAAIRTTLERARAAVDEGRRRAATSHHLLLRSEELLLESADMRRASAGLRAELRAYVTTYSRELRAAGVPPESMLVRVKSAVLGAAPPELGQVGVRELLDDVVKWSIKAFFDAA